MKLKDHMRLDFLQRFISEKKYLILKLKFMLDAGTFSITLPRFSCLNNRAINLQRSEHKTFSLGIKPRLID